jgi:hypothetical protein
MKYLSLEMLNPFNLGYERRLVQPCSDHHPIGQKLLDLPSPSFLLVFDKISSILVSEGRRRRSRPGGRRCKVDGEDGRVEVDVSSQIEVIGVGGKIGCYGGGGRVGWYVCVCRVGSTG